MLKTQEYLKSGKTLEDLNKELGINATIHPNLPIMILNYDQINSPKGHPIVRECRSLILHTETKNLVSRSFLRFFNWGEMADEMPLFCWNTADVYEKVDGCFTYTTKLNLWDGGTIKIGDVVSKKLHPKLMGMNENGEIIPAEVTQWFDNGKKDNWLEISTNGKISKTNTNTNNLRVTSNHSIFINNRWQPAIVARIGDHLTNFDYKPSSSVLHLIRSGLLGDGSIVNNGKSWKYQDSHKENHAEYNVSILHWLGEAAIKPRTIISGYGTIMVQNTSKTYNFLSIFRKEWYPNGIKIVPEDLSWMDDFSVAKWMMDDGSLDHHNSQKDRAKFATHGFSEQDVHRLANKLNKMYGVDAKVLKSKGFSIRVNSGYNNEIDSMWGKIAPHIVPCMRYKLPEKYRHVDYTPYPEGKEDVFAKPCQIISIKKLENTKKVFPFGRKGFDIETTTHNYFAKGHLVHNSLCSFFHFNGEWQVATRGSFANMSLFNTQWQADYHKMPLDFTWKQGILHALGMKDLSELNPWLDPTVSYACEFCSLWNKVVRVYTEPVIYNLTAFRGLQEIGPQDFPFFKSVGIYQLKTADDISNFLKDHSEATFEGVVVKDHENRRWKLKNSRYLALHTLRGNGDSAWQPKYMLPFILNGEESELLTYFPEIESVFRECKGRIDKAFAELKAVWMENYKIPVQKDFAISIVGKTPFTGLLFQLRKQLGDKQTVGDLDKLWRSSQDVILKNLF